MSAADRRAGAPDAGDPRHPDPGAALPPPDLAAFWDQTTTALDRVPTGLRYTRRPGPPAATSTFDVAFTSWEGRRIRGYAVLWDDAAPRPLIVHAHGYRSQVEPQLAWVRTGCHVVGVDIRGFGRSADAVPAPAAAGWLLTGVRRPETSVLRGAVCDYVRATQVAGALAAEVGVGVHRRISHGVSLAGGLATMAEAVAPCADLLVLGVPTFGWTEGRRLLVERGSGAEVAQFLDDNPEYPEEDVQLALSYFDAALLAPAIRCPTLIGVGRVDRVVPAACVEAVVDGMRAPTEVLTFPVSHDSGPLMREWDRFDERWLDLAVHGVPDDFGQSAGEPSDAACLTHAR